MHEHGPTDLAGPLRGTPVWWQGTADPAGAAADGTPARPRSKKGKRMARGQRSSRRTDAPAVRPDLVDRVRQEIAAGTYDSPEKWEAALDRLLDRLQSE